MIKLILENHLPVFDELSLSDPFAVRIKSLYLAYGSNTGFLYFYVLIQEGLQKALLCRMGGKITVAALSDFDCEELYEFCRFFGCSLEGTKLNEAGSLNSCEGYIFCFEDIKNEFPGQSIKIDQAYNLLYSSQGASVNMPGFEDFYADMSHRIRHGHGKLYGIIKERQAVAAAVISDIAEESSVISGAAVKEEYRNNGLGLQAVRAAAGEENAAGRKVYVLCREELKGFYMKCGGKMCGKFKRLEF